MTVETNFIDELYRKLGLSPKVYTYLDLGKPVWTSQEQLMLIKLISKELYLGAHIYTNDIGWVIEELITGTEIWNESFEQALAEFIITFIENGGIPKEKVIDILN
jgi:hypothetical protein